MSRSFLPGRTIIVAYSGIYFFYCGFLQEIIEFLAL
ncbi:unnamed protein product, partial [marine sediment metagenome]